MARPDPWGRLAAAYGVPRELGSVVGAIYERTSASLHVEEWSGSGTGLLDSSEGRAWSAVAPIVGQFVVDLRSAYSYSHSHWRAYDFTSFACPALAFTGVNVLPLLVTGSGLVGAGSFILGGTSALRHRRLRPSSLPGQD
jgi:hypothetical protein